MSYKVLAILTRGGRFAVAQVRLLVNPFVFLGSASGEFRLSSMKQNFPEGKRCVPAFGALPTPGKD